MSSSIPRRYEVRDSEDGRFLHCDEAPRVRVHIDRKLSVSETEARAMGDRVIFLDGAGNFGPRLDNKNRFYNLDHHEGCVRPFTLATCEQALILILNGLSLDEGDWTIYANEPDLDTVLAIWVLLNYRRLPRLTPKSRDILLPLLRLEGAIDANGTELAEFCGLQQRSLREARGRLDALYEREKEFRAQDRLPGLDWREYTAVMLWEVDRLIYTRNDFQEYAAIDEILGHVEIADRKVAVACRDRAGIYEAERSLKKRWEEQLGIIALEKEAEGQRRHYTLRRVSALSDFDLSPAFELLNLVDRTVDGRPPGKRWGGSEDIGGSPRDVGTKIAPVELLRFLEQAYRPTTRAELIRPWTRASLFCAMTLVLGSIAAFLFSVLPDLRFAGNLPPGGHGLLSFALIALVLAIPTTWRASGGRFWLFGWRRPAGYDWLYLAPAVIACALPATAWVPAGVATEPSALAAGAGVLAATALATETWFRGLIHGWFLFNGPLQRVAGTWFVSRSTLASALFYAGTSLLVSLAWRITEANPFPQRPLDLAVTAIAALAGGAALGMIRERSLSIWPGVMLQILGGAAGAALAMSML